MIGFTFRQLLAGIYTDEALAGMAGQEVVVTAAAIGDIPLPFPPGRYRVTGVTRVAVADLLGPRYGFTDVRISFESVDPEPAHPSGEDPSHANPGDRQDRPARA